ncbi:MAG: FtsX-like permease family protein [Saprospiraceae bacterium]|nr:FtsX-like permease family protein [Saprospiraceae bacterium]
MFKNFLLTSWRSIKTKPGISILNVFSLAIGIAVFLFIFLYAQREWSFDQFHKDAERIYRVVFVRYNPGQEPYRGAAVFPGVGSALKRELGEIEEVCRVVPVWGGKGLLVYEEKAFESEHINYVDTSFFRFFSFPLLEGNPNTALKEAHTAVLSQMMAHRIFGKESAIGKRITLRTRDGEQNYEITGIYDDTKPSHIKGDILLSFSTLYTIIDVGTVIDNQWNWFDYPTYVKLHAQTNIDLLDKKFPPIINKYGNERVNSKVVDFDLQPLTSIHLYSNLEQEIAVNGDGRVVNFLMIIALFTLGIAWINYINLYTAKATERAKEVGIRKTLGANRSSLLVQFFLEAALVNLAAILAALVILWLAIPLIANMSASEMQVEHFIKPQLFPIAFMIWLLSTVFSGLYPSLFLSNFSPLKALTQRGAISASGNLRKALVTLQFMASAILIGGTILIYQQLHFINNKDLGINTENVMIIDTHNFERDDHQHYQKVNVLKNALSNYNGVHKVAYSSDVVGQQVGWRGSSARINKANDPSERKLVYKMVVGAEYLDFYDVKFLAGRNYQYAADSLNVIINEAALNLYGFENAEAALEQRMICSGVQDTLRIIGVVENYFQESLREGFKPTVYLLIAPEIAKVSVRIDNRFLSNFISFSKNEFDKIFPQTPFKYALIDEVIAMRHQVENNFFKLFNLFALLAIFIAFLGLIGLSHFVALKRQKEVGIRKILGSSMSKIVWLVFKDFAKLVMIGNIIAIPILYFSAREWLNQFAFRIDFNWMIPILSMIFSIIFAFIFSFFNLRKLSRVNPVEVLKYE